MCHFTINFFMLSESHIWPGVYCRGRPRIMTPTLRTSNHSWRCILGYCDCVDKHMALDTASINDNDTITSYVRPRPEILSGAAAHIVQTSSTTAHALKFQAAIVVTPFSQAPSTNLVIEIPGGRQICSYILVRWSARNAAGQPKQPYMMRESMSPERERDAAGKRLDHRCRVGASDR